MGTRRPKIIVIVGPTASGKTELGIMLAKKFNGEIINADSRQIYRHMDIGTGKPRIKNQELRIKNQGVIIDGVKHHLMSIVDPDEEFTVALWKKLAIKTIKNILKRKKLPIVVGGTGLYVRALVENLDIPEVPPDLELRKNLELRIKNQGLESVYKELIRLDPDAADLVDSKNPRRVIRAVEVCLKTGKPFSQLQVKGKPLYEVLELGIDLPRGELYRRIDKRVEEMFKSGLLEETEKLLKEYKTDLPAMSGIGYREAGEYLLRKIDLKTAIERTKLRTHAYAKRQYTWFKRTGAIHWLKDYGNAEKAVKRFLS